MNIALRLDGNETTPERTRTEHRQEPERTGARPQPALADRSPGEHPPRARTIADSSFCTEWFIPDRSEST